MGEQPSQQNFFTAENEEDEEEYTPNYYEFTKKMSKFLPFILNRQFVGPRLLRQF